MSDAVTVRFVLRPEFADLGPPQYASDGAAAADLRAALGDEPLRIEPGESVLVPTGLTLEIPRGYEGQIRARSGLALKKGLTLGNGVGTIDSDYRGEVGVIVLNLGKDSVTIKRGDRIAQLVIAPVVRARFLEAEELASSVRSGGGFGSTGNR